jgi:hypothetical protein
MALPQERSAKKQEMEYKRIEREMRNKERERKQNAKLKKRLEKQHKKWEKQKKKYEKKGLPVPPEPKLEMEPEKPTEPTTQPKIDLPEAEIITAEADVWTPQSARNLDEIQKRIDRMDKKHIRSLTERYKDRFGEDLEVPDIYNVSSSIDVDTAEATGEIESVESSTSITTSESKGLSTASKPEKSAFGFGRREPKEKKAKGPTTERQVRFFDFRTPLYLLKKFTDEDSGGGKKAIIAIFDIFLILVFPLTILRIITTPIYMRRDSKEARLNQELNEQSSSAQPS